MAERMLIDMVRYWGVVRFMVVWLEIQEYVTVAESKIQGLSTEIQWLFVTGSCIIFFVCFCFGFCTPLNCGAEATFLVVCDEDEDTARR